MRSRVSRLAILILFTWARMTSAAVHPTSCPTEFVIDAIVGCRHSVRAFNGVTRFAAASNDVIEGDEGSLLRALNLVHKNSHQYVAVLFYASWCPFSRMFKPTLSVLASLYPSIPHFVFEESAIRPSILSKYGVHGFPTLFIMNSTMRVRYQGARTPSSLIAFYSDVTGIKTESLDQWSLEKAKQSVNHEKNDSNEQESCPFSWARSPENMLRQETYLALASAFVILRLLRIFFPTLISLGQSAWRKLIRNIRFGNLFEHPVAYLKRAVQLFNSLKVPCKRSDLQEGAMNVRVWASKSLATVSIGDASTSRGT